VCVCVYIHTQKQSLDGKHEHNINIYPHPVERDAACALVLKSGMDRYLTLVDDIIAFSD